MLAVKDLAEDVGVAAACEALAVPRASFYRWRNPPAETPKPRPTPPRALSGEERQRVRDVLNSEEFVDQAPAQVYATLLDRGVYHCSVRSMYRILEEHGEVRERRDQLRHPVYTKPELIATGPNQVWSWDVTKLPGPAKWTHYSLYVILDIFSRYVVGWLVAERENAALAKRLIEETVKKQGVSENELTLHSDRGPPMKSSSVAQLLAHLGVTKSHSRPHTSNDNPFSEAQFKTLKYRPEFPRRFGSLEHARSASRELFHWYNHEHRHSGIALMTPFAAHYGKAPEIYENRRQALEQAYRDHPERFVGRAPEPPRLPEAVWINPPAKPQPAAEERPPEAPSACEGTPPSRASAVAPEEASPAPLLSLPGRPHPAAATQAQKKG